MFGKVIKSEGFNSFRPVETGELGGGRHKMTLDNIEPSGDISILENKTYRFKKEDETKALNIIGFDESILEYKCLEGEFKATSFCFSSRTGKTYNPAILLDLRFISRISGGEELKNIWLDSNNKYAYEEFYHETRLKFVKELDIHDSLVFIDGPLFSGRHTEFNYKIANQHPSNDFVFFVKNSESTQIIDKLNLQQFNNDLHWAYKNLNIFERSPIFHYKSQNREKLMCCKSSKKLDINVWSNLQKNC